MKVKTFEYPKTAQEYEFPAGAVVADLIAKLGQDAVVKVSGVELSPEKPLSDGMFVAVTRKNVETGEKVVKKIAGAGDERKKWVKAVKKGEFDGSFDDWLDDLDEEEKTLTPTKGMVIFNLEKFQKQVEFNSDIQLPEGINVIGALQLMDLPYSSTTSVTINGEEATFGTVINDGDKVVLS